MNRNPSHVFSGPRQSSGQVQCQQSKKEFGLRGSWVDRICNTTTGNCYIQIPFPPHSRKRIRYNSTVLLVHHNFYILLFYWSLLLLIDPVGRSVGWSHPYQPKIPKNIDHRSSIIEHQFDLYHTYRLQYHLPSLSV